MAAFDIGSVVARVTADVSDFTKKMDQVRDTTDSVSSRVRQFGTSISNVGKSLTTFATVPVLGLGASFIKLASDAEEMENRFSAVFGDLTQEATAFSDALAEGVGRSVFDIQSGLVTFQSFAVGMGLAADEAFAFSSELQTLAVDFASFNNISDGEAQERFIAAMSGSSEVLDQFGVNLKVAVLDQKLLDLGFKTTAQGASEAEKAIARLEIIRETMGRTGALGDAARTAESTTNQTKALLGEWKDLSIELGTILLPLFRNLVLLLRRASEFFSGLTEEQKKLILVVGGLVAALGPLLIVIGAVVAAVGTIGVGTVAAGAAIGALGFVIFQFVQKAMEDIEIIKQVIKAGFEAIGIDLDLLKQRFQLMMEFVVNVLTILGQAYVAWYSNFLKPTTDLVILMLLTLLDAFNTFRDLYLAVMELIAAITLRIITEIIGIFNWAKDEIGETINLLLTTITQIFSDELAAVQALVTAVWSAISSFINTSLNGIKNIITAIFGDIFNSINNTQNDIKNNTTSVWNGILGFFSGIGDKIVDSLVNPFRSALDKIKDYSQRIRDAAKAISPFERQSPSLVDLVTGGVAKIEQEYSKLANLSFVQPSLGGATGGSALGGGLTLNINLAGANISSSQDAQRMSEMIGNQIINTLGRSVRF